ncbi:MAG TPA: alcohol dehydrogenase catalytic domain-containing protein, partial [Ktedonobacterales bacterium]|nr:alcohol dehydrogenase catalytic domain-containing protein [Ktedonobacterales bacterium]
MLSAYLEQSATRVGMTRLLGRVSRRAYFGPLAPLQVRQIGRGPLPGRRWVRVRNTLAGVAEDDVERVRLQVDPSVSLQAPPQPRRQFLGREVTGEVVEVGSDVQFLRVGDRVAYQLDQCCATRGVEPLCRQCAVGAYNLCENRYLPGPEG